MGNKSIYLFYLFICLFLELLPLDIVLGQKEPVADFSPFTFSHKANTCWHRKPIPQCATAAPYCYSEHSCRVFAAFMCVCSPGPEGSPHAVAEVAGEKLRCGVSCRQGQPDGHALLIGVGGAFALLLPRPKTVLFA